MIIKVVEVVVAKFLLPN